RVREGEAAGLVQLKFRHRVSELLVENGAVKGVAGHVLEDSRVERGQPSSRTAVDRKSTRLNSSHVKISYAVFCLKKKNNTTGPATLMGEHMKYRNITTCSLCILSVSTIRIVVSTTQKITCTSTESGPKSKEVIRL